MVQAACRHVASLHVRHAQHLAEHIPNTTKNNNPTASSLVVCLKCGKGFADRSTFRSHSHGGSGRKGGGMLHSLAWIRAEDKLYCLHCGEDVDYSRLNSRAQDTYDSFMKALREGMSTNKSSPSSQIRVELDQIDAAPVSNSIPKGKLLEGRPPGLSNLGNTCFMNSALQCLAAVMDNEKMAMDAIGEWGSLHASLKDLLTGLLNPVAPNISRKSTRRSTSSVVHPTTFFTNLSHRYEFLERNEQQDSHDFLRLLFNALDDEWELVKGKGLQPSKPKQHENSVIERGQDAGVWHQKIFGGQMMVRVQCSQCGGVTRQRENSLDLSLSLNVTGRLPNSLEGSLESLSLSDSIPLSHLLREWRKPQILQGQDAFACDRCTRQQQKRNADENSTALVYTRAICEYSFAILPSVLIIHLQRFISGAAIGSNLKSSRRQRQSRHFSYTKDNRHVLPSEFLAVGFSNETRDEDEEERKYQLLGMVVHQGGSVDHGHYICLVRRQNGRWFRISDASVVEISREEALRCGDAYILFYSQMGNTPASFHDSKDNDTSTKDCDDEDSDGGNNDIDT